MPIDSSSVPAASDGRTASGSQPPMAATTQSIGRVEVVFVRRRVRNIQTSMPCSRAKNALETCPSRIR